MNGEPVRRPTGARIGVAALNLLSPGLGLIRLGRAMAGLLWIIAAWAFLLLLLALGSATSVASFGTLVAVVAGMVVFALIFLIVPTVQTWRSSGCCAVPAPWWTRWYMLVVIGLVSNGCSDFLLHQTRELYRGFYIPAESMVPTLLKNDRVTADMRWRTPNVGDIAIIGGPDFMRVVRIAAVGGQTFAMEKGVPIVDGRPAVQKAAGRFAFQGFDGVETGARLAEQLPGEHGSHFILDLGPAQFDDVDPVHVPPGFLFVLGDNRDRAADSRVPRELQGAGLVPMTMIVGRPLYIHWSSDRSRIGLPVSH